MKTAEEWMQVCVENAEEDYHRWIRAIQADALRHAAESCRIMASIHSNPDLADCHIHSAERIEAEAQRLEAP